MKRKISLCLALILFFESLLPYQLYAVTSGPTQPEFSSFQQINATDMVDVFTGDFKYNIPLLNIPGQGGGYPINLHYNSVTNIEEEASMVGLGWNIGIGNITRDVKGVPDDFDGDLISRRVHMKPEVNAGVTFSPNAEIFSADLKKVLKTKASLDFSVNYSSYNGLGFGLGFNLQAGATKGQSKLSGSVGLNSNSFDGLSYSAKIGFTETGKGGGGGIGLNGNSIDGLTQIQLNYNTKYDKKNESSQSNSLTLLGDRPTSYNHSELEFNNYTASFQLAGGAELWGFFPEANVGGYFNERILKNNNRMVKTKAYGLIHSENGQKAAKAILDYNRIHDKPIYIDAPNLPLGVPNPDVYSVTGQGISGTFCFERNDVGSFREPNTTTNTYGFSLDMEAGGGGLFEAGGGGSAIIGKSQNKATDILDMSDVIFRTAEQSKIFEPGHFRFLHEMTGEINYINQHPRGSKLFVSENHLERDKILNYSLNKGGILVNPEINKKLALPNYSEIDKSRLIKQNRKPRSNVIMPFRAKDIYKGTSIKVPFLDVKYANYSETNNPSPIGQELVVNQSLVEPIGKNPIAAFSVQNAEGMRYIYGLPVKNHKKREVVFSVDEVTNKYTKNISIPGIGEIDFTPQTPGSEEYLDITETPEYISSYALTSILGNNYIDVDPTDGLPNDKDRGYWVRFDYVKTDNSYKWRMPFSGAKFNPGFHSIKSDDKASYLYGEREQYYPYRIETNTHVAKFYYSPRQDARGALSELQNTNTLGAYSYKLDKIELYTKGNITTLEKTIHFYYNESGQNSTQGLCSGTPNSAIFNNSTIGKLTLKKIAITNYQNTRGLLTPYEFEYYPDEAYDEAKFDRWGVYKKVDNSTNFHSENYFNPYTEQNEEEANDAVRKIHLKSIILPSGAKITVDIGRDHYRYVQDKHATQMFKIKGIGQLSDNIIQKNDVNELKIHFQGMPGTVIQDYLSELYTDTDDPQILFKIYSKVTKPSENNSDYVSGAAYVDINGSSIDANGNGIIKLKPLEVGILDGVPNFNKHPFLITSWQNLKINLRKVLTPNVNVEPTNGAKQAIIRTFERIKTVVTNFQDLFKGFYKKCYNNDYGTVIDIDKSFIRLQSATGKKYGGGVRVNSVIMTDIWNHESGQEIKYGTIYEYEETLNGKRVSTGVAANEPYLGMEENAVYYMNNFAEELKFTTDLLHFELHPYNDHKLPGPVVGYSKVFVRSLPSNDMLNKANGQSQGLPSYLDDEDEDIEISTTGQSTHEFYTAKDFPVIMENSLINKGSYKPQLIPIPFIGFFSVNSYGATQSYLTYSNDMHGKPKKISYQAQDQNGNILESDVSSISYFYKQKKHTYSWGKRKMVTNVLDNEKVPLQVDYQNTKRYDGELGVDRTMNGDVVLSESVSSDLGVEAAVNTVLAAIFPVPIPGVFPIITRRTTRLTTGVINKEIHKRGILEKTIVYDGQSKVETNNIVFDPYTGDPVVTSVTDHFDHRKYMHKFPGYLGYNRMGPAYENTGYFFNYNQGSDGQLGIKWDECSGHIALIYDNFQLNNSTIAGDYLIKDHLVPGDEVLIENLDPASNEGKTMGVFLRKTFNCCDGKINYLFAFNTVNLGISIPLSESLEGSNLKFTIIRSGKRNNITAEGQNITSLNFPSSINNNYSKVLSASSTKYSDYWRFGLVDDECEQLEEGQFYQSQLNGYNGEEFNIVISTETEQNVVHNGEGIEAMCLGASGNRSSSPEEYKSKSYFIFDLPTMGVVLNAKIKLFADQDPPWNGHILLPNENFVFQICRVDGPPSPLWDPMTLTYNTQPNVSSCISINSPTTNDQDMEIDITSLIQEMVDYGNYGLCLRLEDDGGCGFENKGVRFKNGSNGGNESPLLTIEYTDPNQSPCTAALPKSLSNEFSNGSKGIFYPEAQYMYRANRQNPNISEKGIFTNFELFPWNDATYGENINGINWIYDNKIMKRNRSGQVVESKNPLNIYSSRLIVSGARQVGTGFGVGSVDETLVHATTENAQYFENCFASFESYENQLSGLYAIENFSHFDLNNVAGYVEERYNILDYLTDGIIIDKPGNGTSRYDNTYNGTYVGMAEVYKSENGSQPFYTFNGNIISETRDEPTGGTKLELDSYNNCDGYFGYGAVPNKIIIRRAVPPPAQTTGVATEVKAHTGKQSLKLSSNMNFQNYTMEIFPEKDYYFSAWIYCGDLSVKNISETGVGVSIGNQEMAFIGGRINGWQQIAGRFSFQEEVPVPLSISVNIGSNNHIYLDDVRIHPLEAMMQSYVYDPNTFQLKYILDDNNYFTKYVYDSEGKLVSVQKETERGIKSLQENRSYVKNRVVGNRKASFMKNMFKK